MDRKTLLYIIEWGIALAACIWLIWKMATYDNYAALWESLRAMNFQHYIALLLCIALMPLNMTLEAWRWRTLVPMSWHDAHYQVYYSKLAGLITPWRLGEYPARALLRGEWAQTLSMGAVGSATMTAAIVLTGLVSLNVMGLVGCLGQLEHDRLALQAYLFLVIVALVALLIFLALTPRFLRRWATVSRRLILISLGQSLVRLTCWCLQLALILYALGAYQSPITNYQLSVYYLLVTITPAVPIVEAGVRGVWAITLFGSMNAAFAGVLLWGINTLLPCCIWPFLRKNKK